jgi:hypothetical protein
MLMKETLLLAGILLAAGNAHAQGSISSGGGLNSVTGITTYRIASMRCDGSGRDPRASEVIRAKNDGQFLPSTFASYDHAIEIGQLAADTKPPMLAEIARSVRDQKWSARQSAVFIVEQDQCGRMITEAQLN